MAHIAGLVATGAHPSPFEYADIVTTTTHKTLRGPRGALIFYKKGGLVDFEKKINLAVFPGLQGGPHQHTISGIAVALKQARSGSFKDYQSQVLKNCQVLVASLKSNGLDIVSGGSDNHLALIDLRNKKSINGSQVEKVCERAGLVLNKNTVPGDKSAINPSGLRVGTPAMTSRGAIENDFKQVAEFIARAVGITKSIVDSGVFTNLTDFSKALPGNIEIQKLRIEVESFATKFDHIGSKPL
jgi:glycine hydroxymethyltransferase